MLNITRQNVLNPNDNRNLFISIPFFGTQSEKLRVELLQLLRKYFTNVNFYIILTNKYSLGSLFSYKDKTPLCVRSSVVYKYCCSQCESSYIGSTIRSFNTRVSEHKGVSCRTGRPLTSLPQSSIRDHSHECDTPINISNFKIIGTSNHEIDLRILESLFIFECKPVLNNTTSAFPLSIVNNM